MIKHDSSVAEWEDPVSWCAWYIRHGFMVMLRGEESHKLLALAAARPVNDTRDGNIPYKYAEDGPCIFVDFLAIEESHPLILPTFGAEMRQRFGRRETVAYQRVRTHNYDHFVRNMLKVKGMRPYEQSATA
jgi:hypothetical protein